MHDEDEDERKSLARYKPDISLGNIIQIVLTAGILVVWGARLEGRVDAQQQHVEQQKETYDLRFRYIENSLIQQRQDLEKALGTIERSLQRIEGKLDGKADKQ